MPRFIFLIFLLLFSFSNVLMGQSTCFHEEDEPISKGYECLRDTLYFTNTVETQIKGGLLANKVIIIKPHELYAIIIKVNDETCEDCANGDGNGGTTIKTNDKTGGGKDKKIISSNSAEILESKIILKRNPVKEILEFSLPENINISSLNIYDSGGKIITKLTNPIKNNKINLSNFPNGKYWISIITTTNKKYTLTFIKN